MGIPQNEVYYFSFLFPHKHYQHLNCWEKNQELTSTTWNNLKQVSSYYRLDLMDLILFKNGTDDHN